MPGHSQDIKFSQDKHYERAIRAQGAKIIMLFWFANQRNAICALHEDRGLRGGFCDRDLFGICEGESEVIIGVSLEELFCTSFCKQGNFALGHIIFRLHIIGLCWEDEYWDALFHLLPSAMKNINFDTCENINKLSSIRLLIDLSKLKSPVLQ